MAKTKIVLLYERSSRDDEVQGESFSIQNQENICQGGFHHKDEIPLDRIYRCHNSSEKKSLSTLFTS